MTILAIEDALQGATPRKSRATATPDQEAAHPATNLLDSSPAIGWKTTGTDPDDTRLLFPLEKRRRLQVATGSGTHNLQPDALFRVVADAQYAERPVVVTDGAAGKGVTGTTIPGVADATFVMTARVPPQAVGNQTTQATVFAIGNGLGYRFRVYFRDATDPNPFRLACDVANWGAVSTINPSTDVYPEGQWLVLAVRYTNSTKLTEFFIDGVSVGSVTPAAAWPNNGDERLAVGVHNSTSSLFGAVECQDAAYYGRPMTDAEISAYSAKQTTSTTRDLLGAWHFQEGTGTTVADVRGLSTLTLTSATWASRPNPNADWDTGVIPVWGQWRQREALKIAPGTYATSPVIGSATRSSTMAGVVRIDPEDALVDNGAIGRYGASLADAQVVLVTTSDGKLKARCPNRHATVAEVTSDAAVNDGVLRRWRVVLDGRQNTLSLYLATDGDAAEVSQGAPDTVTAFTASASCKLELGDSLAGAEATCLVSDVRLYSAVVLEADDSLTGVTAGNPDLLAGLRLAGTVNDMADTSRSYTTAALTWGEVSQTTTTALAAADERLIQTAGDLYRGFVRKLVAKASSVVEDVQELGLWIFDPDNTDGFIRLATFRAQAPWEPGEGRFWGAQRIKGRRPLTVSGQGLTSVGVGARADSWRISLGVLEHAEAEELHDRIPELPDELVTCVIDDVAQHRLPARTIVGTLVPEGITDPTGTYSSTAFLLTDVTAAVI